jgi:hypothetical protein
MGNLTESKEVTVKTLRLIACFVGLVVFVALGSPRAQAQAEIDPDHYETGDAEPLPQSKTIAGQVAKISCEGNFLLPSSVLRCNGSSLPPGKYLISVDSGGRTVRITLDRRDPRVSIERITQRQNRNRRRNRAISVAEEKTP